MSDDADTPLDARYDLDARMDATDEWLTRMANDEADRVKGAARRPRIASCPTMPEILAFEETNPGHTGGKERAIRDTFPGMTIARYYQCLNSTINTPTALEHNPMLVNRLRDLRDRRTEARASRTFRTTR